CLRGKSSDGLYSPEGTGNGAGTEEKAGKMPCGSFCGSSFFLPCSLVSERSFSGCRYPARTLCRRNDPDRIRRKERRPSSEYCVYAVCRGVSLGRISGSPGGRRGLCEDFSPLRPLRIRGDGGCRLCGRRFPDPKKKYISGYFVLAWEKTG